ncbi:DUF2470 domain-containing protein [Bosea sp. (in: a-proteobacteria)]|uniref:HugZ family pyridoxamine 5'-phosphate oxidase n=1 Tax=Bosea sp. (in: a-proteobacteria) TaxID=1871050 RepID=UPI002608D0CB|nr:DUF2470 domain-containing protein [Bosea sp. (in: a-proteobacteria)]MCO5090193.1 pyridoxamine 5'-phosphate oxidase family protein [Bosea sp. (in: a-proteobacteria)]
MARDGKDVIQPMDEAVRAEAKGLLRGARSATLATLGPDGHPFASLVGLATDIDGTPVILVSGLAAHTGHLAADPRASLLISPGGKGDPLAHARITLKVRARKVVRESEEGLRIRRRYLARQPKAALYADFPDFAFFALEIEGASLNGGFARAFAPTPADLKSDPAHAAALAEVEEGAVEHMNEDHAEAIGLYATRLIGAKTGAWRAIGLDPDGLDMALGSTALRLPFPASVDGPASLRDVLAKLAVKARGDLPQGEIQAI